MTTFKSGALRALTVTGIAALHTDLSRMALALFIVHAVLRFTVDIRSCRGFSCHVGVGISASLLKTVATGFPGMLCLASANLDLVQVTKKIPVVPACLNSTF